MWHFPTSISNTKSLFFGRWFSNAYKVAWQKKKKDNNNTNLGTKDTPKLLGWTSWNS